MTNAVKIITFIVGTIAIFWISRPSLRDPNNHGFYRFFAWEVILVMFLANVEYWFLNPFSPPHITSWILLIISLVLIILGVGTFRKKGRQNDEREDPSLIGIEKTTALVTSGIYGFIRHPFYSSLLFLGWGIMLKHASWFTVILAGINTLLLLVTAKKEEVENIEFFGEAYRLYMAETKMFIPFVF
jgi:protein-S-isoprenylcysteine O-methyltransferase Ste14